MSNETAVALPSPNYPTRNSPLLISLLQLAILTVGIGGNVLALFVLRRTRKNRRHQFLLRCLAIKDFVALAGMLLRFILKTTRPKITENVWMCRQIVLWRFFGMGSGCVAVVMAVDRWLAITRPFFYHEHITFSLLKRIIIVLWLGILCLVCAPFFGIFRYWEDTKKCIRIGNVKEFLGLAYSTLVFSIGVLMCIVITYTNLCVIIELCTKKKNIDFKFKPKDITTDSTNGASVRNDDRNNEERSFSWLMFFICVLFVVCWLPQLISIPLAMYFQDDENLKSLFKYSDSLLLLYFSLDPYVYVLQKWKLVISIFTRTNNSIQGWPKVAQQI